MAACGSLQHIFENPIPENPSSFIDSLSSNSWKNQIKPPLDHSFTEIFGELQFKENPNNPTSSSSSSSFPIESISENSNNGDQKWGPISSFPPIGYHKRSESFSSMNSDSLQLCTEGLGFESLDDVDDLKMEFHSNEINDHHNTQKVCIKGYSSIDEYRKRKTNGMKFPPPISSIGRSGKPWVCFQSYREDGRFVLKEIRIPTQELLHACRKDGRLRLCFVQPSDQDDNEINQEDDDDDEEEREEEEEEGINGDEQEEGEYKENSVEEEENEVEIRDDFERGNS